MPDLHKDPATGSVYVFRQNGLNWDEGEELTGGAALSLFGQSVDLDDGVLAVGTPGDDASAWTTLAEGVDGRVLSTQSAGGFVGALIGPYAQRGE